jgi:hypothetical protein
MTQSNQYEISKGDLVRLCTAREADSLSPEKIEWCYGLYLGKKEDSLARPYGWKPFEHDKVLHNGHIMVCDKYWHIERVE